jgi:hypothetical protein
MKVAQHSLLLSITVHKLELKYNLPASSSTCGNWLYVIDLSGAMSLEGCFVIASVLIHKANHRCRCDRELTLAGGRVTV